MAASIIGGRAPRVLAFSVVLTAVLYAVPYGRTIAWPLVLVSTLAHELGHGLAAALLGGHFYSLRLYADASGVALWGGAFGRMATALVAAAGLVGPAAAAFVLLLTGRRQTGARRTLIVLGIALLVIAVWLVRNPFGLGFTLLLGTALVAVALRAPGWSQAVVVFLAVQLALAVFSRADYLFTSMALTRSGPLPSDVSVMADALFLPYWVWGALCGAVSLALLGAGARAYFK
jgi:hypothetical protein